jgi:predicted tellurium resistance membrane protein TerC
LTLFPLYPQYNPSDQIPFALGCLSIENSIESSGEKNLFLLLFGLVLSIPLVVCGAGLLSMLMDRYPIIVWMGAAILGKVGGERMITDPWVEKLIHTTKTMEWDPSSSSLPLS